MRVIIPGFWNVSLIERTIEASVPDEAIKMASDLLTKAGSKWGLFVTATLEK
jgi:hypothetical protein